MEKDRIAVMERAVLRKHIKTFLSVITVTGICLVGLIFLLSGIAKVLVDLIVR